GDRADRKARRTAAGFERPQPRTDGGAPPGSERFSARGDLRYLLRPVGVHLQEPGCPGRAYPGTDRPDLHLPRAAPRAPRRDPPFGPDKAVDTEQAVAELTQRCATTTEAAIVAAPDQWLWLHNRWRTRPAPLAASRVWSGVLPSWCC